MPQITLTREQTQQIVDLCEKHGQTKWFFAKDEGAYIGACGGDHDKGTFENVIFYFRGMNPKSEKYAGEAWDNARDAFGGDDFGDLDGTGESMGEVLGSSDDGDEEDLLG